MFKVITERDRIRQVVSKWSHTYDNGLYGEDKLKILEKLRLLDLEKVSAEEIASIIGNSTWTDLTCDECNKRVKEVFQVGEEYDYASTTIRLCVRCIKQLYDATLKFSTKGE